VRDRRFDVEAASPPAEASSPVRIFYANIAGDNEDPAAFLEEIPKWDPEIIVLVEFFYYRWQQVIGKTLPFSRDVAVFSKRPIEKPRQMWTSNRMNLSFDVEINGVPVRMLGLHSPRPMDMLHHDYAGFWSKTIPQVLDLPDPAIVVGDFNATQYSRVYQTLTADLFRSAHEDRGRGYATTWPNGMELLPPIRIDQALLSRSVECVEIQEGRGLGSDHKPLIIDVRVRQGTADQQSAQRPGGTPRK
jgi:endonuclease/exonuclease/phosphatase (EEP) superfamily protein YafD